MTGGGRETVVLPRKHRSLIVVVGMASITLMLHGNRSLKGKRSIIKGIKGRVSNSFNVSVAEVDLQDSLHKAVLGIAAVGNDRSYINSLLDKVINKIEGLNTAEIIDTRMEIMNI